MSLRSIDGTCLAIYQDIIDRVRPVRNGIMIDHEEPACILNGTSRCPVWIRVKWAQTISLLQRLVKSKRDNRFFIREGFDHIFEQNFCGLLPCDLEFLICQNGDEGSGLLIRFINVSGVNKNEARIRETRWCRIKTLRGNAAAVDGVCLLGSPLSSSCGRENGAKLNLLSNF